MQRFLSFVLILVIFCSLTACGRNDNTDSAPETTSQTTGETADPASETQEQEQQPAGQGSEAAWTWSVSTPQEQGLQQAVVDSIHETFDTFPLLSAAIIKNGYLVDTYYKDGYDDTTPFLLNSASKSITSAMVGIAIELGYIESVQDPLSKYLPQVMENTDSAWQQITIWHLLTHTSGISTTDEDLWEQWRASDNWVDYILALPMVSTPGTSFLYSTGNTHLLCAVLQQATGMNLAEFAATYLFEPLDMDSARIDSDPQGISDGGNGIWLSALDMAKFGQLYLNGGVWEGEQIIPADWIEQSTTVQYQRSTGSADCGYQWWVRTFGSQDYHAYFAQGHAGQYIFVVPALQLVVTFTSDYTGATSIYWNLMEEIVAGCTEPDST